MISFARWDDAAKAQRTSAPALATAGYRGPPTRSTRPDNRNRSGTTAAPAYTALAWVIVFAAFHLYWYLGGNFGHPYPLPDGPDSAGTWLFTVVVTAAFPIGAWACLALARGRVGGRARRLAVAFGWLGSALLLLRGGLGVTDELARTTGLLANGITGLSLQEVLGVAHPTTYMRWSSRAIEAYFLAGGLIFGWMMIRVRQSRQS